LITNTAASVAACALEVDVMDQFQWRIYSVEWVDLSTGPKGLGARRGPLAGKIVLGAVVLMCRYYKKKIRFSLDPSCWQQPRLLYTIIFINSIEFNEIPRAK